MNQKPSGRCCATIAAILLLAPLSARAQFQFTAAEDNLWTNPDNWTPSGVPGDSANTGATITVPSDKGPVLIPGGFLNLSIGGGTAPGGITMNGGNVGLTGGLDVTGFQFNGGFITTFSGQTLTLNAAGGTPNTLKGTFDGTGTVRHSGNADWFNAQIRGGTFQNHGTIHWLEESGGGPSSGGTLYNLGTIIFEKRTTGGSGTGTLNNSGDIRVNAGAFADGEHVTWSQTYFQSGGSLEVHTGLLQMVYSARFGDGTISLFDDATLTMNQAVGGGDPFEFSGLDEINGAGTVNLNAGPMKVTDFVTFRVGGAGVFLPHPASLELSVNAANAGNMTLGGALNRANDDIIFPVDFTNRGQLTINGGSISGKVILKNESTLTVPANASVHLETDSVLDNLGAATLHLSEGSQIRSNQAAPAQKGTLLNKGTIRKTGGGTPAAKIEVPWSQSGVGEMQVHAGSLIIAGPTGALSGNTRFLVGGNARLDLGGIIDVSDGTHAVLGLDGAAGSASFGGNFSATDRLKVAAGATITFSIPTSYLGSLGDYIGGPGTIINTSDFGWSQGTIGDENMQANFQNQSLMRIGGNTVLTGTLTSTGRIIQDGPIRVEGTLDNSGKYFVHSNIEGAGSFLNKDQFEYADPGGVTINVPFTNAATVTAVEGTLTFTRVADIVNGELRGTGTWQSTGGVIHLPGIDAIAGGDAAKPVVIRGNGASIPQLRNIGAIDNGRVQFEGDTSLNQPLTNGANAHVEIIEGKLAVPNQTNNGRADDPDPQTSILTEQKQMLVVGGGGGAAAAAVSTIDASVPVPFARGLFTPVLNNRGTIRPGGLAATGPFHLTGDLVSFDSALLEIEIGGAVPIEEHDQLLIDGDAHLAGELDVTFLNPGAANPFDSFTVLAWTGTLSGAFANAPVGGRIATADGGGSFAIDYDLALKEVRLHSYVPEPAAPLLLLAAATLAAARPRRR